MELCGLCAPTNLDGHSLLPLLRNPNAEPDRSSVTLFGRGKVSVRLSNSRYIRYADGSEELYDHSRDPHEWRNVVDLPRDAAATDPGTRNCRPGGQRTKLSADVRVDLLRKRKAAGFTRLAGRIEYRLLIDWARIPSACNCAVAGLKSDQVSRPQRVWGVL